MAHNWQTGDSMGGERVVFGSVHNGTAEAHTRMNARAHARMRTRKATA